MISTFLNNKIIFALTLLGWLFLPVLTFAQGSVSLSVSPTLFEMTGSPQQTWSSDVRVINANPFPIQIYAEIVNFKPSGETGQGVMVPVFATETDGATLAEWITVDQSDLLIPAEQTVSVPFNISVPENAAHGGHFAAILIGTRALPGATGAAKVETSQVVTSLIFLSVAGDIVESGQIRDFTTDRKVSESPEMNFSLRFENNGNVHLQPQGEITITNMWGSVRGVVPINQTNQFGNVLPDSVRKYSFAWSGDWSFADIGRYTAVATLAYGDKSRQFTDNKTTFWVIPWKALIVVVLIIAGVFWLIASGLKFYIRRMLQLSGVTPELTKDNKRRPKVSITAPIEASILDLRSELNNGKGSLLSSLIKLSRSYKVFLLITISLLIFIALFIWYLILALSGDSGYEVSYEQNGQMIPLSVEESPSTESVSTSSISSLPVITLVDRSGVANTDQVLAAKLRTKGYDVTIDAVRQPVVEEKTVVVFDPSFSEQILQLQDHLGGALISSFEQSDPDDAMITIYIGNDQVQ